MYSIGKTYPESVQDRSPTRLPVGLGRLDDGRKEPQRLMWVFTNDLADNLGQERIHPVVSMSHPRHNLRERREPLPRQGSAVVKCLLV